MDKIKLPKKLYKYRPFNVYALRAICDAEVYYANPAELNDPFECDPVIEVDIPFEKLESLCYRLHLKLKGKEQALKIMGENRYASTEFGDYKTSDDARKYYTRILLRDIKSIVKNKVSAYGVLSLSKQWDCTLMWTHYADNHRGICIEYETGENLCKNIHQITYGISRAIKTSTILEAEIKDSLYAQNKILDTFFYSKASKWRYEKEWRDVSSTSGATKTPLRITGVYFGLRCDNAVRVAIVRMINETNGSFNLFNIYQYRDTFNLKRGIVETDEIRQRTMPDPIGFYFTDISNDENVPPLEN